MSEEPELTEKMAEQIRINTKRISEERQDEVLRKNTIGDQIKEGYIPKESKELELKYFVIKLKNYFTTKKLIAKLEDYLKAEMLRITGNDLARVIINCQEDDVV